MRIREHLSSFHNLDNNLLSLSAVQNRKGPECEHERLVTGALR